MVEGACILVQCHHSDLLESEFRTEEIGSRDPRDPDNYCLGPLVEADIAPIMLAAPDVEANRRLLPALAERWGVGLFLGDELDVARRLVAAARSRGADTIARVVLSSFYVDPGLVRRQLELLCEVRADYCALPRDFNINFGADVVAVDALELFHRHVERLPAGQAELARYRPWPFLELLEEFSVSWCEQTPDVPAARIEWIRSHPNWPERAGPGCEGGEYHQLARDFLGPGDVVLDAGCGHGEIANILSGHCAQVVGVDYDNRMIRLARERFPQCRFEAANLERWNSDQRFDVILHCHTLEHLADPVAVMRNLAEHLKTDGKLIVEVPLLMRPGMVNPHHHREYTVQLLLEQVREAGLDVLDTRGVARGIYREPELAREAYVAVCTTGERAT